jgi:hypothetical protein
MNKNRMIVVSMVVMLVLAVMASSASASPAPSGAARSTCTPDSGGPYALGIDGGLTGLSRGELVVVAPAASSARPLGVDGGVLSLLFARSHGNSFAASAGNACTGI